MTRKITIKGEVYSFDDRYSLPEAIALEEGLGMTFGEWTAARAKGSARALAGYLWLVLRRGGQDVALADILSGKYEIDFDDLEFEDEGDGAGPTPASSPSTGGGTSESSPRSSDTPPATSTGSARTSSTT